MSKPAIQCFLMVLVMAIIGFDKHFIFYCPGEIASIIMDGTFPSHYDLPVKRYVHHEDITIKSVCTAIPSPPETEVFANPAGTVPISRNFPHTIWQPPELYF
jgi:hypothetical protein